MNQTGDQLLAEKNMDVLSAATGRVRVVLSPEDTNDIVAQPGSYSIERIQGSYHQAAFTDANAGARADCDIVDSVYPEFVPSQPVTIPTITGKNQTVSAAPTGWPDWALNPQPLNSTQRTEFYSSHMTTNGSNLTTVKMDPIPQKPGSATKPFFGVVPVVLDPATAAVQDATETDGVLCIADSWPGQMRTLWGDHARFEEAYFSQYKGYYFTGDGCRRDADGYYWITGRVDDVINVSGHRMGTAEVESALVAHPKVAESAVVGYPHDIKGQGIYAYVTLMNGEEPSEALRKELEAWVRTEIGPIAKPDLIQWAPGLPKTRSGKIMRRILRKIAENDYGSLGDTSTLADPSVVDDLIANRMNRS
jgi:hypothetical protein